MKKNSLIVFALLLASACQDDETRCYKCTVSESGKQTEFTRCDITKDDAYDIERAGTIIDPEGFMHIFGVNLRKHTRCVPSD